MESSVVARARVARIAPPPPDNPPPAPLSVAPRTPQPGAPSTHPARLVTASDGPEFVVAGSWINAAVIGPESVATFGLEALNARVVVTDWDARPLAEEKRGRSSHRVYLRKLMEDMRHFVH